MSNAYVFVLLCPRRPLDSRAQIARVKGLWEGERA